MKTASLQLFCHGGMANCAKKIAKVPKQWDFPVKIILQEICKSCKDLALNLASLALKMKFFLQELKNLALILQELARKNCKIIFLQDMSKKNTCKTCTFLAR